LVTEGIAETRGLDPGGVVTSGRRCHVIIMMLGGCRDFARRSLVEAAVWPVVVGVDERADHVAGLCGVSNGPSQSCESVARISPPRYEQPSRQRTSVRRPSHVTARLT
jgi:hypothetical protein